MSGVYVSYPFCAQKCTYCNFASGVFPRDLEPRYIGALLKELRSIEWPWTPETVYLGGGTPSQMNPADLDRVLAAIPGCPWSEATLEAAPGSLSQETVVSWKRSGINRVSLGVQSFVQRELARTGRKHTAEVVAHDFEMLRRTGIDNLSVDLIAGLPGQTSESWQSSLNWIERLSPPHVSLYMLEVDEDSRLGREVLFNGKRYGAPEIPSDELIVALYETGVAFLESLGLRRYEISNFARDGFESAHNLKYWRREPYLGFGSDAHSFDGELRWQNIESPSDYVEAIERGDSPRESAELANATEEKFFVGLRLASGIRPEGGEWDRFREPIDQFIAQGLLESNGGTLRLTDRGILFSNEVFQEFIGI